jgi:hypothetical protein
VWVIHTPQQRKLLTVSVSQVRFDEKVNLLTRMSVLCRRLSDSLFLTTSSPFLKEGPCGLVLHCSFTSWVVALCFFSVVALFPPITIICCRLVIGSWSVITHPSSEWFSISPMVCTSLQRHDLDLMVFWRQLIGGWLMSWPFFQIPPFRAVVSVLLVDSSVCPIGIRRFRPIRVARAWITTFFSGKEVSVTQCTHTRGPILFLRACVSESLHIATFHISIDYDIVHFYHNERIVRCRGGHWSQWSQVVLQHHTTRTVPTIRRRFCGQ